MNKLSFRLKYICVSSFKIYERKKLRTQYFKKKAAESDCGRPVKVILRTLDFEVNDEVAIANH